MSLPLERRKKKQFYVLDYGLNCDRHDPWDMERNWQELWRAKPKRAGVPTIKTCPMCNYVNNAGARVCENCGYEWPKIENEPEEEVDTILVEMTAKYSALVGKNVKDLTPQELADYAKSKGKQGFAQVICKWHYIKNDDRQFIKDFAKAMHYKPYWAKLALDRCDEMTEEQKGALEIKDVILK